MRFLLAIVCSLLFVGGQFASISSASVVKPSVPCCQCGGQMPCCAAKPVQTPQPLPANSPRTGAENQLLSPLPLVTVSFWSAAGPSIFPPSVSPSLNAAAAPVFARLCVRLI